ncbi:MAG: phosphoribosylformylglycinamidine synthase subunit PurS [Metallosphaera sp.]
MIKVELIIINKDGVRDPEGETLKRYVVDEVGKDKVADVRVGKVIVIKVNSSSREEAEKFVARLAEEKRLYNPIVHKVLVRSEKIEDGNN